LKRVIRWAAVICTVLLVAVLPSSAARADDCTDKDEVYWGNWLPAFQSWQLAAFGTRNKILLKARSLADCDGVVTSWSTANLKLGGVQGNWVEAGWDRWKTFGGVTEIDWFIEWGLNYTPQGSDSSGGWPCTYAVDTFDTWTAYNTSGTNWSLQVSCLDGTGHHDLGSFPTTTYNKGTPTGETGRWGGTNGGMHDEQKELRYRDSSGNYVDWSQPKCFYDNAPDVNGSYVSSTEYHVDATGGVDC